MKSHTNVIARAEGEKVGTEGDKKVADDDEDDMCTKTRREIDKDSLKIFKFDREILK